VIKALATTKSGQSKESLVTTYKAIGRSIIDYAAPIWSPNASQTSFEKLQVAQNAALRAATGCHLMSNVDHLHAETSLLKVKAHSELLSAQYLAKCYNPDHPCHEVARENDEVAFPREVHMSLRRKHKDWVAARMVFDPGGTAINWQNRVKELHTEAVGRELRDRSPNRVLGEEPPDVNRREKRLPRQVRCVLSQLRSGFCRHLKSYQHKLNPLIANECPDCHGTPHDVLHIFNCPVRRNPRVGVRDLWSRPIVAGRFLHNMVHSA
jgi:hypothetical protein